MYLQKNINAKTGRVYLQIVHKYRAKETKKVRSKTIQSIGYLDELEKQYDDPVAYFSVRIFIQVKLHLLRGKSVFV